MTRALSEQVVVLTGASSGVGRETALRLASRGATVIVAARNVEALDSLGQEVERLGGTPVVVPTDVSQWQQVQALAQRALDGHGRIDTWINCAAVALYGTVLRNVGLGPHTGNIHFWRDRRGKTRFRASTSNLRLVRLPGIRRIPGLR